MAVRATAAGTVVVVVVVVVVASSTRPGQLAVNRDTLSFPGHAGQNKVSFQGRISHAARLKPGSYTLIITATNVAGQHSAPARLRFAVAR
jgi:hypothetical protein